MSSKLHQNAILTGCLDHFCLVCETHLRSQEDGDSHVAKPIHQKSLAACLYLDKYKPSLIRKVKQGYYCESCNLLLPTATKVGLHIKETIHTENQGSKSITRLGKSVLISDEMLISETAWNGLITDTCAICNSEFSNFGLHVSDQRHVLNLIEKKVYFAGSGLVYRMIDESSFHCLVCNMIFATSAMDTHSDDDNHKTQRKECQNLYNKAKTSENEKAGKVETPEKANRDMNGKKNDDCNNNSNRKNIKGATPSNVNRKQFRDEIMENTMDFQKNGININYETETVSCKKCLKSLDFDTNAIKAHIDDHKNNRNLDSAAKFAHTVNQNHCKTDLKTKGAKNKETDDLQNKKAFPGGMDQNHNLKTNEDESDDEEIIKIDVTRKFGAGMASSVPPPPPTTGKDDSSEPKAADNIADFAKQNHITYNKEYKAAFCRPCNSRVPANMKNMKEHTLGASHKSKAANYGVETVLKTSMDNFVERQTHIANIFGEDDIVMNDKFCVTRLSFFMVTVVPGETRTRCQACEVNLSREELGNHLDGYCHQRALERTPVVRNFHDEFVREVRPGVYHCGFCNQVAGSWAELKQHLSSTEHGSQKTSCSNRLSRHLPRIREQRAVEFQQDMIVKIMLQRAFGDSF